MTYHEKSFGSVGTDLTRIMAENRITGSWAFLRMTRAWSTMDASLNYLVPNVNYSAMFRRCVRNAARRQLQAGPVWRRMGDSIRAMQSTLSEISLLVSPVLRRNAHQFQGVTSKLSKIGSILFRGLSLMVFFIILMFVGVLLHHVFPQVDVFERWDILPNIPDYIPGQGITVSLGLIAANLLAFRFFRRLERTCREKEYFPAMRRPEI